MRRVEYGEIILNPGTIWPSGQDNLMKSAALAQGEQRSS